MQRILVVKLADLGDLLTATPALRALRLTWPTAEITALVTPHSATLLEHNDAVDHVIRFPKAIFDDPRGLVHPVRGPRAASAALELGRTLRARRFDAVVLLHHLVTGWGATKYRALARAAHAPIVAGLENGRGSFLTHHARDAGFGERHEVEYGLDVVATLGASNPDPRMELHLTREELSAADEQWTALGLDGQDVVALHPGSGSFSVAKRWTPEGFGAVGDALAADGLRVGIVAGPGEEPLAEAVRRAMRAPSILFEDVGLRAMAATLKRCRLFVGNDSGVMHLAATVGTPVVAVFGLSNHRAWGPYPPAEHQVVRLDLPCSPCLYRGTSLGDKEGCPPRTCLTDLSPELVVSSARRLLGSTKTEVVVGRATAWRHDG